MTLTEQTAELDKLGTLLGSVADIAKRAAEVMSTADFVTALKKATGSKLSIGLDGNATTLTFETAAEAESFWPHLPV